MTLGAPRQPTRAEILARIALSSKDAVVLEEMQHLGFWPKDSGQPTVEADLIRRETELQKALNAVHDDLRVKGDPEAALKAMRKQRMAESRAKREATAQRRAQERFERAKAHFEAQKTRADYLGAGVSAGLGVAKAEDLSAQQAAAQPVAAAPAGVLTPPIATPLALAQAIGISLPELKFLSYHRSVSESTHYRRFAIAKKTGGQRWISAPMPRLKRAQYWVLDNILAKAPCHPAAHGFVPGRSIVTNATPHAGHAVVINIDLKDFFPSVKFPRIKGVFEHLGYAEPVAAVLALLCSENVCDVMEVDQQKFYVGHTARERQLPQGAPTSPMLTNILCRTLDRRLQGIAAKLGFVYTRYADDLTFSAIGGMGREHVGQLLRQVRWIVQDEGFTPHPDKQHVMHSGQRQMVTGVVVNQKPSAPRSERRKLRAALHRASSPSAPLTWQGKPATPQTLLGYARFAAMVSPLQGAALLRAAQWLAGGLPHSAKPAHSATTFRQLAAQGKAPLRPQGAAWWQPAAKVEPVLEKTAGQIAEERRARLAAERAAREAARRPQPAAEAAPGTARNVTEAPEPAESQSQGPGKTNWSIVIGIILLLVSMAAVVKSRVILVAVLALAGCWFWLRPFTWKRAAWVVVIAVALERLLR